MTKKTKMSIYKTIHTFMKKILYFIENYTTLGYHEKKTKNSKKPVLHLFDIC